MKPCCLKIQNTIYTRADNGYNDIIIKGFMLKKEHTMYFKHTHRPGFLRGRLFGIEKMMR